MSLDHTTVEKIAHLARLAIHPEDISLYTHNLSNILKFVAQMDNVDTQAIEPMAHPLETTQRLRQDIPTELNQRELFQSIAPSVEVGLYLVPQVIADD